MKEIRFTHLYVKGFGWENTIFQREDFNSVEKLGENKNDGIIYLAFQKNGVRRTLKDSSMV